MTFAPAMQSMKSRHCPLNFLLDEALDVGVEAWEVVVEVACELQVLTICLFKRSPGINRGLPDG
jgi:hypothetical protein